MSDKVRNNGCWLRASDKASAHHEGAIARLRCVAISKVLESFVAQWMLEAIGDKFDEKQFGGLRGRSTVHALIDILHL